MPYIKQIRRQVLDPLIKELHAPIHDDGEMNYVITKLLDNEYGHGRYEDLNRAMGVLSCVAQEFYRRRIAPYEDEMMKLHGEVFE